MPDPLLKLLSITTGQLTVGTDRSVTYGSPMSVGWNVVSNEFILGVSIPTGFNSSAGVTINVNGGLAKGVGIVVLGGAVIITGSAILSVVPEAVSVFGF